MKNGNKNNQLVGDGGKSNKKFRVLKIARLNLYVERGIKGEGKFNAFKLGLYYKHKS